MGALIANVAAASANNNDVTTAAISTQNATLIVIAVSFYEPAAVTPTISDSKSNTWTPRTKYTDTTQASVKLFYCYAPTVSSSATADHTFTASATGTYPAIAVIAVSGAVTSPYDVENGVGVNDSTLTQQPGSITPSQNNSLIIDAIAWASASVTSASIDSGFTKTDQILGGSTTLGVAMAYLFQGTAAAVNPTWTYNAVTARAATQAAFKNSASGSAALTGTAADGMTEAEVVSGGQTIVITLTGTTWVP